VLVGCFFFLNFYGEYSLSYLFRNIYTAGFDTTQYNTLYLSMAQIPLGSTRLDSTRLDTLDFVEPVEPVEQVETSVSSETSCAFPTWRTTNDLVQV